MSNEINNFRGYRVNWKKFIPRVSTMVLAGTMGVLAIFGFSKSKGEKEEVDPVYLSASLIDNNNTMTDEWGVSDKSQTFRGINFVEAGKVFEESLSIVTNPENKGKDEYYQARQWLDVYGYAYARSLLLNSVKGVVAQASNVDIAHYDTIHITRRESEPHAPKVIYDVHVNGISYRIVGDNMYKAIDKYFDLEDGRFPKEDEAKYEYYKEIKEIAVSVMNEGAAIENGKLTSPEGRSK